MNCLTLILAVLTFSASAIHVTFSFDDGWDNHYPSSLLLDEFGYKGTYYVNSNKLNVGGRLSTAQLVSMQTSGHEIAGHTKNHARLTSLSPDEQEAEICEDRAKLIELGFQPRSFAYPYGGNTPESFELIIKCGYNSARDSGGLRSNTSCTNCPAGEFIPPSKPYLMRSISYTKTLGITGLQWYVEQAETEETTLGSARWVNLVFHEFGDFADLSQAVSDSELRSLLQWLTARPNLVVKTTGDIVEGVYVPVLSDLPVQLENLGKPHIVFTFDGGTSDHVNVSSTFCDQNMKASFMIVTKNLGKTGYMTYSNLKALQEKGHEIGGNGRTGGHLLTMTSSERRSEICGCKTDLEKKRLTVTSYAWAYGESNADLQTIAGSCGYNLGRDVGGLRTQDSCLSCPTSLTLPLGSPMELRAFVVKSYHTMGDILWQIRQAEENLTDKKRALIFIFGTVCNQCAYSPDTLRDILVWLKYREPLGTKVSSLKSLVQ